MPYDYLTINENDLPNGIVSASYLPQDLQSLYEQKLLNDGAFFGDSGDDIIEFTIYNSNQEPISFNRIVPKVTYSVIQSTYRDINNVLRSYNITNPYTNYAINKNDLLLHTQFDLKINELSPGLYYTLYNPIRNIAGNSVNKLFIKEISPSRTELRLSFAFNPTANISSELDAVKISAFADKKYVFLQIIDEIVPIIDNNTIDKNFNIEENNFNYYKYAQLLGFKSTAELQSFINSTYVGYNKIVNLSNDPDSVISQNIKFTGIAEQLKNFVYTYNTTEFSKEEILSAFQLIVAKVSQDAILQRTSLTNVDLQETLNVFQKIIYSDWLLPQIINLLDKYNFKFYDFYKNALNFDNGNLVKILTHTSYFNQVDGRTNIQIKLDAPLPMEYSIRDTCWISNISLAPLYFKVNLYTSPISRKVYLNGTNFTVAVPTIGTTNDRFEGLDANTLFGAKSRLKIKVNDLLINYNDFSNFINFSSAELRTKIAKNKLVKYQSYSNDVDSIKTKSQSITNTSISASYSKELSATIQQQIVLLDSFDEYESYLFYYTGSIDDKIDDAVEYDKNNYNSLFYQLPDYIKSESSYADYVKFTAMVGHFFDNILVFIKKFPKTYPIDYNDNNHYPKNYIEELLNSFNWNVTNIKFNTSDVSQLLFNNQEMTGSLSSSYFDYAKSIFNRITNNLPYIYKTKGTANSFNLIRTIFGISSDLINVVEYSSPDVLANRNVFYNFDDIIYATKYDTDQFINFNFTSSEYKYLYTQTNFSGSYTGSYKGDNIYLTRSFVENFTGISTLEMTFRSDQYKRYNFEEKIPLIKKLRNNNIDWQIYLYKTKQKQSAKLIFELTPIESKTTSSISSIEMPYLNGNFYTMMLRKTSNDSIRFDSLESTSSNSKIIDYYGKYKVTQSICDVYYPSAYKYIPQTYTLSVNQYYGSQLNFTDKKSKTILFDQDQYFSSGSYYVGNYSSSIQFYGNIDKIKVQKYPLSDSDFQEHSYNLNSISIPEKALVYDNMYFLWSFDTPVDLGGTGTPAKIANQNNKYYKNNFYVWNFDQYAEELGVCNPNDPQSEIDSYSQPPPEDSYTYEDPSYSFFYYQPIPDPFSYQFEKFNIKQAINSNKYGPNYKANANINKINQNVDSNLVPYEYSTYTTDILGSDSNVVGYYITPYEYLNNNIEDFLGKEGISDIIGDPKYLTARNYPELKLRQTEFAQTGIKYTYPQEYYTTYKFYIDFSIFDFIKKLTPARSTLKTGLLLEPSIFERVKFNYKDAVFDAYDANSSSSLIQFNINTRFTSSLIDTNDTSSHAVINIERVNKMLTDHDTYNYSLFEINDACDDRDFIFANKGKYVYINSNGYNLRNVINYPTFDYYQISNNVNNTSGSYSTFTSSYNVIQIIGSGSGLLSNQVTGSRSLKNLYSGSMGSGYSNRHLSKFVRIGTRVKKQAVSGSNYKISNGVSTLINGKLTYYTYTKGKNDYTTTVNRNGLPNGSSPIISIPGFLALDIESDNFPLYGTLTGSAGAPNSLFIQQPLTCSACISASLNNYIMNL